MRSSSTGMSDENTPVFDWPGLGLYACQAILTQDFMPVIGVTLVIAAIYLLTMVFVDVLYGIFNPRVRIA